MKEAISAMPQDIQLRSFGELSAISYEHGLDVLQPEGRLASDPYDSVAYFIGEARALLSKVRQTGNYIRNFNEKTRIELPVGIKKVIGGVEYVIGISRMRLLPTHAEFDAYMQMPIPQNGDTLYFMARGLKFSDQGGIVGDVRLELLADQAINFKGDKIQLILKTVANGGTGTYVTMDCEGFKELSLDADIVFSRDILLPENASGDILEGRVSTQFATVLTDWNDLLVQVSLPAFQVPQLSGVGITVTNAVFDFSDIRNAPSVNFPAEYEGLQTLEGNLSLWRGFYLRELSVRLPEQFKNKSRNGRTSFAA